MNVPKTWIFDLDGVIVETAQFHYKSWKRLAHSLDIPFDESHNEALKGVSRSKSLNIILELDDREVSEKEFQRLMDKKNGWYQNYIAELTPDDILDGIPEFLDTLKERGAKLAIGSSSKNAQYILDYLQLTETFDAIIDGTKVKNTKPDPEVFLKGAQAVGEDPEDCVVFEDAESGVEAANRANMLCVGVGSEEILGDADLVIDSFVDMSPEDLLEKLS
ncbi:beta-phosphoglucomutase [Fodinibius halophilus]|uniref:Beta-phosphoglucomutase n=1 Tax=Fodinibius halophilus TaxID=1736908 RepID=A0A6M1T502_9BACT|nr:beta-phosphoglucomutase [Fodinibius halophilus]NGP87031.1 beta-phosphoglucomutase [Fodinibius halophilus]